MKRHVNLPYLRASTMSGDHERGGGLRGTVSLQEKKNSVWVATTAENEGGNSPGTYLIAIPASQRGHTRSESFCPSRYVSRLLKEEYDDMYGLYMSKRTIGCSSDSS
jgi:hypothetical protein